MQLRLAVILALGLLVGAVSAASAERRVALVVGNGSYQNATPLANPLNDARDVAAALQANGFDVVEVLDADKRKLDAGLRAFADKLADADVALLFYAGHGLQVGLQNYLLPVDAKLERERDLEFEAVRLDFILRQMEIDREGKTTIVFLDACRDNPLARNLGRTMGTRSTSIGRGLAAASTGLGTFIAYSTQPGNVALDGDGRNSPFTTALVRHMGVKGRTLASTMIEVRKDVVAATGGKQVPWDHSALTGDFYFAPGASSSVPGSVQPAPAAGTDDVAALQARLKKLEDEARRRSEQGTPVAALPPARIPSVAPKAGTAAAPRMSVDENVRIDGLKYSEQRQPNAAACRDACEADARCLAFQHGRRSPVMGQCHLFARVDGRQEDASWRSGVKPDGAAGPQASASRAGPPVSIGMGVPLSRRDKGFDVYDGIAVIGDPIKMSATDSSAGCQAVCRNTPGCVAATYNEFFRGKNVACQVYRSITDVVKTPSASVLIRSE